MSLQETLLLLPISSRKDWWTGIKSSWFDKKYFRRIVTEKQIRCPIGLLMPKREKSSKLDFISRSYLLWSFIYLCSIFILMSATILSTQKKKKKKTASHASCWMYVIRLVSYLSHPQPASPPHNNDFAVMFLYCMILELFDRIIPTDPYTAVSFTLHQRTVHLKSFCAFFFQVAM